jgi:hypothetical protein
MSPWRSEFHFDSEARVLVGSEGAIQTQGNLGYPSEAGISPLTARRPVPIPVERGLFRDNPGSKQPIVLVSEEEGPLEPQP